MYNYLFFCKHAKNDHSKRIRTLGLCKPATLPSRPPVARAENESNPITVRGYFTQSLVDWNSGLRTTRVEMPALSCFWGRGASAYIYHTSAVQTHHWDNPLERQIMLKYRTFQTPSTRTTKMQRIRRPKITVGPSYSISSLTKPIRSRSRQQRKLILLRPCEQQDWEEQPLREDA